MKKLLRMLLIVLFLLSLTLTSTAFADGRDNGNPPVLFYWGFDKCGNRARTYSVFAVNQANASVHDLGLITVNDGAIPSIYDGWPGGRHTNPYTATVDSPILNSRFRWHWGYGGGPDYTVHTGAPPACQPVACNLIDQAKVVRYTDGVPAVYDELWFTNCTLVDYRSTDVGSKDTRSYIWFNEGRNWEWVYLNGRLVQHGFTTPPTAHYRFTSTIKDPATGAGGSWPTNP